MNSIIILITFLMKVTPAVLHLRITQYHVPFAMWIAIPLSWFLRNGSVQMAGLWNTMAIWRRRVHMTRQENVAVMCAVIERQKSLTAQLARTMLYGSPLQPSAGHFRVPFTPLVKGWPALSAQSNTSQMKCRWISHVNPNYKLMLHIA